MMLIQPRNLTTKVDSSPIAGGILTVKSQETATASGIISGGHVTGHVTVIYGTARRPQRRRTEPPVVGPVKQVSSELHNTLLVCTDRKT